MSAEPLFRLLTSSWEVATLGDVCRRGGGDVQTGPFGSQLHASDYVSVGIPSIMPLNIGDNRISEAGIARITPEDAQRLSKYLVRPGDIVYSRRGDVERRALVRERENGWLCGTGCLRIRFGGENIVYPPYAAYYLGHPLVREWIVRHAQGATMPNLNTSILSALPFVLPTIQEQMFIASILSDLDDKIELNRQTNHTLEQIAQIIFKSWFVNFEPVKAKIEAKQNGQDPERAAMCAISGKSESDLDQLPPDQLAQLAATAKLFPDELADSEKGATPENWKWSTIGKEVDVVGGGTPSTKVNNFWDDGIYNWTTPKDLSGVQEKILLDTERKITKAGLEKISSGLLPVNTVLLSSRAPVGYLALAKRPVAINQGYIAMKCADMLPPEYVLQWAESVMDEIKQRASGTTFAEISKKNFRDIPVLVPNPALLGEFQKFASAIYEKIKGSLEESKYLTEIRESLLPKLLSGGIELTGVGYE